MPVSLAIKSLTFLEQVAVPTKICSKRWPGTPFPVVTYPPASCSFAAGICPTAQLNNATPSSAKACGGHRP